MSGYFLVPVDSIAALDVYAENVSLFPKQPCIVIFRLLSRISPLPAGHKTLFDTSQRHKFSNAQSPRNLLFIIVITILLHKCVDFIFCRQILKDFKLNKEQERTERSKLPLC